MKRSRKSTPSSGLVTLRNKLRRGEYCHWVTIDPSGRSCGYVRWHNAAPSGAGLIRTRKSLDYWTAVEEIADEVGTVLSEETPDMVFIEFPEYFASSGGRAVAVKGDLVKLAYCVGQLAHEMGDCSEIHLLPVREWKGQAPKGVVERQVREELKGCTVLKQAKSDMWDALGMGLWVQERLWRK